MQKFTTPGGKDIEVYHKGMLMEIRFVGGGELPEALSGKYTSFAAAKTAIEMYIDSKTPQEKPKKQTTTEKLGLNPDDYKR